MKTIERVQTGIRVEKRVLKVSKALAEALDMTLGDLIECMILHAFDGKAPFGPETLKRVAQLRAVYDLDLRAEDAHELTERNDADRSRKSGSPARAVRKRKG